MRILITWGSTRGGTEGIARMLGDALVRRGVEIDLLPARQAIGAAHYDAAVVGGALYANRWHADARRFVARRAKRLREVPTWFFSSGPLDDSATERDIPPVRQVAALMALVGAQGHVTFGGRIAPDAKGFPASAMAKNHSGDWRSTEQVDAWAADIARALPTAAPKPIAPLAGASIARLVAHGVSAWAACAATMAMLLALVSLPAALTLHAIAAPLLFTAVARRYFLPPGSRAPLASSLAMVGIAAILDSLIIAGLVQRSAALFSSFAGFWLPLGLGLLAAWATGEMVSTLPWPKSAPPKKPAIFPPTHSEVSP